jgi:hypothetical protein
MTVRPLPALRCILAALAALLAGCETQEEMGVKECAVRADCADGEICRDGTCVVGCRSHGECGAGFCVGGRCQFEPPVPCDCLPTSLCTLTAEECRVDHPPRPCLHDEACDDRNPCTIDLCIERNCEFVPVATFPCCAPGDPCDDGDPCTVDACVDFRCLHVRQPGCCTDDVDCDDGDACTASFCDEGRCTPPEERPGCCRSHRECLRDDPCRAAYCVGGRCTYPVVGTGAECACLGTSDCDDGNPCTEPLCLNGRCDYAPPVLEPGAHGECCLTAADCPEPPPATRMTCASHNCVVEPLRSCLSQRDCDDRDACTINTCVGGFCETYVVAAQNCCNEDADCRASNECVSAVCRGNRCEYEPALSGPDCCVSDGDCSDGVPCTDDRCVSFRCVSTPTLPGCCTDDQHCIDENPCVRGFCGDDNACQSEVLAQAAGRPCCAHNAECDDGDPCTDNVCVDHRCTVRLRPRCCSDERPCPDDGNPCTTVTCEGHLCRVRYEIGCCTSGVDCHDGDPCTVGNCQDSTCRYAAVPDCCRTDSECPAGGPCERAVCDGNVCTLVARPGCCVDDSDCPSSDPLCVVARCIANACVPETTGALGCCVRDADCAAAEPCYEGRCESPGRCTYSPRADCCLRDADCDDGDYCTDNICRDDYRCETRFNGGEGCCLPWTYVEGFESAFHRFSFEHSDPNVRWRIDSHRVHLGAASLYYGLPPWYSYDGPPGQANSGTATSPELLLPPQQPYLLRVFVLLDVRPALEVDTFEVRVLAGDDDPVVVWSRDALAPFGGTTGGAFFPVTVALDRFAGRRVRVQFAFDSVDFPASTGAGRQGVFLDTLSIDAVCGAASP